MTQHFTCRRCETPLTLTEEELLRKLLDPAVASEHLDKGIVKGGYEALCAIADVVMALVRELERMRGDGK